MAKLPRIYQRLFGSTASAGQIGSFGSLSAGSPTTTVDPVVMQSLSNWLQGLYGAVVGDNSPAIEDINAVFYVFAYQLGYLFQAGIAEWETTTIYYQQSVCNYNGNIYISLTDTNAGNLPTDVTKWKIFNSGVKTVTSAYTVLSSDNVILADATSGPFDITLPLSLGLKGKRFTIKQIDNSGNQISVLPSGSDLIDLETAQVYGSPLTGVDWIADGVSNYFGL